MSVGLAEVQIVQELAAIAKGECNGASKGHTPEEAESNVIKIRTGAVDLLGRLKLTKDDAKKLRVGTLKCLLRCPAIDSDAEAYFVMHVVQSLAALGANAQDALPELALARGSDATVNHAIDAAETAIGQPAAPQAAGATDIDKLIAALTDATTAVGDKLAAAYKLGVVGPDGISAADSGKAFDALKGRIDDSKTQDPLLLVAINSAYQLYQIPDMDKKRQQSFVTSLDQLIKMYNKYNKDNPNAPLELYKSQSRIAAAVVLGKLKDAAACAYLDLKAAADSTSYPDVYFKSAATAAASQLYSPPTPTPAAGKGTPDKDDPTKK